MPPQVFWLEAFARIGLNGAAVTHNNRVLIPNEESRPKQETKMNNNLIVLRSTLIMPGNKMKFLEKAWQRNADAIIIDLEDSVADSEKKVALGNVKEAITLTGKGGARVLVRINSNADTVEEELTGSVYPGLYGIVLPKVESAEQILTVDKICAKLEKQQGLPAGSVRIALIIESAVGIMALNEICAASPRSQSLALGIEDLVKDLGITMLDGNELLAVKMQTLIACVAYGLQPRGLVGSFANFRDLEGLHAIAKKSYQMGFHGSGCIHPDQVAVLNKAFAPDEKEVETAIRIVTAYDEALARGEGAISVDGKMIDVPVADKARNIVNKYNAIQAWEKHKQEAMARAQ